MTGKPQQPTGVVGKFRVAVTGIIYAVRHQNSFRVHLPVAVTVVAVSLWLHLEPWRWIAVIVSIALVISAELLNSAIEEIVAVVHPEFDQRIGRALDAGAGAVLVASIGAIVLGLIALAAPLWNALS